MQKTAKPNREFLDINYLIPSRRDLEGRLGRFRIILDDQGYPIRIEKRHSTLKPVGAPFSEVSILGHLVGDGVSEEDYQKYVKPHIRYP
ncbi:hypothetical protein HYX08_06040 [Candidatus Woesearchaeota archaeon]|nr:hypothetical protein [Candidatus Woesearchaeota archaeon]